MPVVNFNVFGNKDGNVGIGNNAPTNKLHVTGTSLLSANTTLGAALIANNSAGSAGQVLHSNGSGIYWAADDDVNTTYDLLTVVNSAVNEARVRLKDVNNSNDDILIIGANGITTFSNATAAYAFAVGSSTITVNTTGIHVNPVLSITDLTLAGNLTVLGDTVTLNVASVSIEDSLVEYARNQNDTNTFTDALDIGFYGSYGNTSNSWSTGLFRDQSDSGIWKIFQSNGNVTNTTIDTANSSLFGLAPLEASSFQTTQDGYGSATGAALANATVVAVGNSTVNTVVSYGQSLFARPMASANFDAINIAYNGSWSSAQNFVAGINVTDNSSSLTNTVGRFGITYNSQGVGAFVVRNLYNASTYGSSGVVFTATGTGRIGINIASPQAALDIAQPTGTFGASNPFLISTYAGTQHMRMYMDGNWTTHIQSIQAGANVSALAFGTNSTEYMRISNTGNIGIGTTVPQAPLDLGAGTNGRAITWGGDGVGRYVSIFTAYSASGLVLAAGFHGNTTADSYVSSHTGTYYNNAIRLNAFGAQGIQFFTDTNIARTAGAAFTPTERMRITPAGYVGIGVTSPGTNFHISSGSNDEVARFESTGNPYITLYGSGTRRSYWFSTASAVTLAAESGKVLDFRTLGSNDMLFYTNNAEKMRITSAGNVGIGTSNPAYKLHVEGDFFVSQPAWGGFPLAPNLIHNSYMSKVTSNVPDGFSTTGLTIVAAHPFTVGFEGPYTPTAPVGSVNDPNLATETTPYWYGVYNKGPRIGRGGMADGWHAYGDGKILKVTGTGLTPSSHCSVFMPKELNNLGAKWFFSGFVKIIKGSGFSYGSDAGYLGSAPNFVTKATIDAGPQGWLRVAGIIDTSQITSIDALALSFGFHPDANGDVEAYIALPYLANVNYKGTNLDSWTNSVVDKLMRQGFYIEPVDFATEKMRITSAGRVGIGTTSPAYPGIHVNTASGQSYIHFTRDAQGNTASDGVTIGLGSDTNAYVTNRENTALIFGTNGTERMRINAGGFVGIGTSTTNYLLDAYNAAAGDASLRFKASNGGSELLLDSTNNYSAVRHFNSGTEYWRTGMVGGTSTWHVYDYTNSATRLIVANTGNVGIGTNTPRAKLEVAGDIWTDWGDRFIGTVFDVGTTYRLGFKTVANTRDTQIWSQSNDGGGVSGITFHTGSTPSERMRIDNVGNLRIGGTSTSSAPTLNRGVYLQSSTNNDVIGYSIHIEDGTNNRRGSMFLDDAAGLWGWDVTASSGVPGYVWRTANTERMRITNGGDVGIATNAPYARLTVSKASTYSSESAAAIAIISSETSNTASMLLGSDNTNVISYIQGVNRGTNWAHNIALNPMGGFVGVGTVTPNTTLHVQGTALFRNTGATVTLDSGSATDARMEFKYNNVRTGIIGIDNAVFSVTANAAASLTLGSNNTERMRIASNGNIGIGTNAPVTRLHIGAEVTDDNNFAYDTNTLYVAHQTASNTTLLNDPKPVLMLARQGTGGQAYGSAAEFSLSRYENAGTGNVGSRTRLDINLAHDQFMSVNTTVMTMRSDGNIGIGTTAPAFTNGSGLEIERAGVATLRIQNSNFNASEIRQTGSLFELTSLGSQPTILGTNNTERVRIAANGHVGIGTTSPSHILTVAGQPSFNGVPLSEAIDYDELSYFSIQKHLENNNINCLTKANGTDPTFANNNNTTAPFSKIAVFSAYYEAIGDFIPVQPGERIYGEIYAQRITGAAGTAGQLYVGIARYDKDKNPIATNTGLDYFITNSGGVNVPLDSNWTKYSGYATLPTSHTPFNGSDGGPVRYIRPYIIVNYTSGTITTFIGGFTIRKVAAIKDVGEFAVLGNFGVGTNSPTSFGAGYTTLTTLGVTAAVIEARGTSSSSILRLQADNAFGMVDMTSNHPLVLRTNATERMRITAAGNVGIGGTSPASKLHVFGGPIDSGGASGNWVIRAFDLTAMNTNVGGSILFQGYKTAAGATGNFGAIAGLKENNTDGNESGYLALYTVPNATQAITERMRISSDGDVLIGGTTATGYSATYTSLVIGSASKIGLIKFRSSYNSGNGAEVFQNTNGMMYFNTNSTTTWMVADTSGRVGIGTTDLANKLEVFGGSIRVRGIGSSTNNIWNGLTINTVDLAGSTGNAGVYLSAPYGGGTVNEGFYRIKRGAGDAYNGSEIAFNNQFRFLGSTTEDTSERMRINSAGRVMINTTSISDANSARLTVFGNFPETPVEIRSDTNSSHYNITFRNTNGLIGAVRTQGNDLVWDQVIASGNSIFTTGTTERLRITSAGNVGVITGQLYLPATSSRSKIDLYGGGSVYNIGMQSGVTFGGLQDWAMTFQFNNEADRGFWWGHDTHTVAQGAMALTTDGRLTVAKSIRLGFGESDSIDPGTNYVLEVNGSLAATTKSFVIDHPTKPNHKLRYGSLESPYHGIRLTGEAEVVDGICVVKLPEYIHALCKREGVNIQLTNIKHGKVLWVDEIDIDNNEFTVATETKGNYKFYWSFTAVRKDIEDMIVEYESE